MNKNIVNLTSKMICIVDEDGNVIHQIRPEGHVVSCDIIPTLIEEIDGIKVVNYCYGNVIGLPACKPGVTLIVTFAVLQALNNSRADVVAPDTAPTSIIRDGNRNILGVKRLRKL